MRRKNPFIYYGGKLAGFAVSVFVLSLAVFYIARLAPGDPLVSYYGDRAEKMTAEERAQAEERLGLDEPVHIQYTRWLGRALQGDFGISYKYKTDVTQIIADRLPNTLLLGGAGFAVIFAGALAVGALPCPCGYYGHPEKKCTCKPEQIRRYMGKVSRTTFRQNRYTYRSKSC